jgi:phospholipid/cholesterol/gamma-HCH transport system substrate-binding protein
MTVSGYVKVAVFFIVLGVTGGGYVMMSSDGLNNFNTKIYETILPDATGLSTRSKVFLAGVAVGKIQAIQLEGNQARLKIAFLKDVEIREDAQIARRSSSILGTSVLTLDPGTELSPLIPPGSQINTSRNAGDMNAVMGLVQEMGGQVAEILEEFQKNQMTLLSVSLETFNSIARKVDARSDAELERVSRILESAALITERTEKILRAREEDINASVTDIHQALENIRFITGEIRRGQGNLGQAVYDDRLYETILATAQKTEEAVEKLQNALDNINRLTENVNGVVSGAGEIVDRAVGLGLQVDTQARYEFSSEQIKAGASLRLNPQSNDRWYRIGVSTAPEGISSQTVRETYDANGVHTSSEETRSSIAIDAELARRFWIFTFRGGLLESTAGIGIDIQPIRWIGLSGELFNFQAGTAPNLRGIMTFYPFFDADSDKPWNWLYLQGGINNALHEERDYFLGAGLRFSDREVKGLVGILPVFGN